MRKVKIGIIGAGGIVNTIHVPGFLSCPHVNIVAICDNDVKLAERTAKENHIRHIFQNYRELLKIKEIQGVVIATPNYLHAGMAKDAMQSGKHVLLEKPIAMNWKQARDIYELAKRKKLVNMTAFNYRFIPAIQYLKALINAGKLGEIYHFRAFYLQQWPGYGWGWRCDRELSGTGQLGDVGSHLIDFGRFLVGDFSSVIGDMTTIMRTRKDPVSGKMRKADTDDACRFLAQFKNGVTGVFDITRFAPGRGCGQDEHQYIEINGAKGTAVYELQSPESLKLCIGANKLFSGKLDIVQVPKKYLKAKCSTRAIPAQDTLYEPRFDQAHTFVHGIRTECMVSPDFYDGMQTMLVIDAVVESFNRKRWVKI